MENELRAALIAWLRSDPALASINSVEEEAPLRASPPWLGIAASAAIDWGSKDRPGREMRIALELETLTDLTAVDASLLGAIERRVLALPPFQPGFEVASIRFLRSRSEARENNRRAALLEFRFRLLASNTE
ncbi:tail completion protein gp17 [Erythrobacter dokdonensis]|uniref:DUF3168 domain-containing protein n=1 Tax=Erythrobacter dokdonensis DSW-74 TaxID=1300349 RepID=A0A1A7BEY3_9SPHN|nr:DUF3168 domain-containing protein [Erythrobacter dokdonensis]OBV09947.1 hypothetical protein I603_2843 [Erythrobacter dokdonensis DSW-74]